MRVKAAAAVLALAAIAVLGVAGPASAHDQLLSTDPADGATVTALPADVSLTFSDVVLAAGNEANQVQVMDASCKVLNSGAVQVQDNVVSQAIAGDATGTITVLWRVVSRDGHPVSGEFTFTVGNANAAATPSACDTAAAAAPEAPSQPASSPLPWIIGAVVVAIVIAGAVYLLVSRSRRTDDR
ncbi:copper resistance protein CopC [Microbacterium kribbense]|uniref:Copper resistance protein CopC n=1 Tax=Microbacterium kribbense TaxID=433645 RepID=A0ABP7GYB0_9MICO